MIGGKLYKRAKVASIFALVFSTLPVAVPALAQTTSNYPTRGYGMMNYMMGSAGGGWGIFSAFFWISAIAWTVSSVLICVLLWLLIKKYSK